VSLHPRSLDHPCIREIGAEPLDVGDREIERPRGVRDRSRAVLVEPRREPHVIVGEMSVGRVHEDAVAEGG